MYKKTPPKGHSGVYVGLRLTIVMSISQVSAFNRLPRSSRAPSGLVPNTWHFDLRYISLVPPSHVLFLVQPDSDFVHLEPLPLRIGSPTSSTLEFFPETAEQAAPEAVNALLHSFLTSFGVGRFQNPLPPAYAPWELATDDIDLVNAVGKELKRIGVTPDLCEVVISPKRVVKIADKAFDQVYKQTKTTCGITGLAAATLSTPHSIGFANYKKEHWPQIIDGEDEDAGVMEYTNLLSNATFSKKKPLQRTGEIMILFQAAMQQLHKRTAESVRAAADSGDVASAIEYALR